MSDAGAGLVGSVVHAMAILRHVGAAKTPEGVTSIARSVGINPSSCFNILRTLVAEGFLERDEDAKTYSLGLGPLDLARHVIDDGGVVRCVLPRMQRLADTFNVATTLWRLSSRQRWVLIAIAETHALARIPLLLGQRLPRLGGAMGRCVAAHETPPQREMAHGLAALRWRRPPAIDVYVAQIEEARRRGWATDVQEFLPFTSIAAPIIDARDRLRFCVTQSMFPDQLSPGELEKLGAETAEVAQSCSRQLYGRTAPMGAPQLPAGPAPSGARTSGR